MTTPRSLLVSLHSFVDSGIFKKLQGSERWILPYKLKERYRNEGKNEGIQLGREQGK